MLGKNIKDMRVSLGMSQKTLAEKVGATQGAVYFWEKEINEPTAGYLVKLAKLFETSVDELLAFDAFKESKYGSETTEMMAIFGKLSETQKTILLSVAKEFLNK